MSALAQHVKLYGSVDETTLHLVAFPPCETLHATAPSQTKKTTRRSSHCISICQSQGPLLRVLSVHPGPVRTEMLPERLHALAEAPSAVAEEVIRALEDGTLLHVLPSAFLLTCTPSTRRLIDGICTRLTA